MKKVLKKYLLLVLVLVIALGTCACTINPADDGSDMKTIRVEMNIDYPDADDEEFYGIEGLTFLPDAEDYVMKVEEGATVMQILESFATQNNIEIQVEKDGDSVYVTSIGGVAAGENTGWIYEIEDKRADVPASDYTPVNGDEITWEFIRF